MLMGLPLLGKSWHGLGRVFTDALTGASWSIVTSRGLLVGENRKNRYDREISSETEH